MKPQKDHIKGATLLSTTCNSRRDFLKTLGAVTAGGLSTLVVPDVLKAAFKPDAADKMLSGSQTTMSEELYWHKVRSQFVLKPGLIYMNTGTEGAMPRPVLDHIKNDFRDFASFPMDGLLNDEHCQASQNAVRTKVAEFLGADADEIAMTTNTTEGIGVVANGLDVQEGDEVLSTLHFYPYSLSWYIVRDRRKITLTELELPVPPKSKDEIVSLFENAITPKTKVMSFCHINFTNGLHMPLKELCQLARDRGIVTVIDGAHAMGMLNFNLHEMGCDFYATSPHKWLCAPPGTGVLYMRKEMQERVWPFQSEMYIPGVNSSIYTFQMRGQQCTPAFAGVLTAIDFQNEIGKNRIQERVLALNSYAKEKIIENWGEEKLFSPTNEELSTGLVSFNPFDDPYEGNPDKIAALFHALWDRDIITRSISFKKKLTDTKYTRALRFSTHIYNNYNEIDTAIEAIKEVI